MLSLKSPQNTGAETHCWNLKIRIWRLREAGALDTDLAAENAYVSAGTLIEKSRLSGENQGFSQNMQGIYVSLSVFWEQSQSLHQISEKSVTREKLRISDEMQEGQ